MNAYTTEELSSIIQNTANALKTLASALDNTNKGLMHVVLSLRDMNKRINQIQEDIKISKRIS